MFLCIGCGNIKNAVSTLKHCPGYMHRLAPAGAACGRCHPLLRQASRGALLGGACRAAAELRRVRLCAIGVLQVPGWQAGGLGKKWRLRRECTRNRWAEAGSGGCYAGIELNGFRGAEVEGRGRPTESSL